MTGWARELVWCTEFCAEAGGGLEALLVLPGAGALEYG